MKPLRPGHDLVVEQVVVDVDRRRDLLSSPGYDIAAQPVELGGHVVGSKTFDAVVIPLRIVLVFGLEGSPVVEGEVHGVLQAGQFVVFLPLGPGHLGAPLPARPGSRDRYLLSRSNPLLARWHWRRMSPYFSHAASFLGMA